MPKAGGPTGKKSLTLTLPSRLRVRSCWIQSRGCWKSDPPIFERMARMAKESEQLSAGVILVAFEKLFSGGRGVRKFARSGLRHVPLPGGAVLVEQNPKKSSE